MASLLLKYFTDCPVNSKDMYGNTPLHYAVAHHETTLVKLLLPYLTRYKVNADSRNKSGFTPLLIAASYGRLEVARYMIQKVNVSKVVYDSLYFLSVDDWFHIYYDWPTSTDVLDPDTTVTRRSHNDIEVMYLTYKLGVALTNKK
ncbi:hypothetical protein EB796_021919 [Bugula neritina]|uniref:Uncharacterized protein n=1 Tax=Bugula neritina TaxID=10212 RepID=A0A7J7J210_BUGNE|nr:hypothetical protein EB796_021919 [Bugula neritina]